MLREAILQRGREIGRRLYSHRTSDAAVLLCRLVLEHDDTSRATACRYATTIRQATAAGIAPEKLADWLMENGGMMALQRMRNSTRKPRRLLTITFDRPVLLAPGVETTVVFTMSSTGVGKVIRTDEKMVDIGTKLCEK